MHIPFSLRAAPLLILLLALAPRSRAADDSAEQINARLKAGDEVGWVIEDSANKDGDLAVLSIARLGGKPATEFPHLVQGDVRPSDTIVFDEGTGEFKKSVVAENAIVSLKNKSVLDRLNLGKSSDDTVYFPGRFKRSMSILWGRTKKARNSAC